MKINLRKADALQKSIQAAINAISLPTTVAITRFEHAVKCVEKSKEDFDKNLMKKLHLLGALYEIRNVLGAANASSGVTAILSKMAYLDKVIELMVQISNNGSQFRPNENILHAQSQDLREDTVTPQYGARRETFTVGILSESEVGDYKRQIENNRKMRQTLSDELLDINVKTEIHFPSELEETLKNYNLI